ncbi:MULTISPECIES: YoaK family protein [unclassified Nocardia]|uniref:YoaK family protein n=1 Tax=unclassified Nocardia TaxID=2637762 RepID=UPI001CE4453A|nr:MULTISPECIES: YoaK family protein [unclassified Nocardia]
MQQPDEDRRKALFDSEARLSWVLAALAGLIGAAAFTHTAGYFVTFMTGNTERAVLGHFHGQTDVAIPATLLLISFLAGVIVASWCRRHYWSGHPHGPVLLTTVCLAMASLTDAIIHKANQADISFVPILFVAFGVGALNTSFVKNGEVSVPLSYVTGTLVKLGQGIERHIGGGDYADWLGYFLLYLSFAAGALLGGLLSLVVAGWAMLITATVVCLIVTYYTYLHLDRHGPPAP